MVRSLSLLIFSSLFVLSSTEIHAQLGKTEKKVIRIDKKFLGGDNYRKAIKKGKSLDKKISKTGETPEESYAVNVLLNKAYLMNGNPVKANEYYEKALLDLGSLSGDSLSSPELFNPGTLYINNSRYPQASEFLNGKASFGDRVKLHDVFVQQGELLKAAELEA